MNPNPPQGLGQEGAYAALIKPGDAVETPDGALWVVEHVGAEELTVLSAHRDGAGQICADTYEQTRTVIPTDFATKVADARQVRRP